jgi:type IV pilus assembly protein PilC
MKNFIVKIRRPDAKIASIRIKAENMRDAMDLATIQGHEPLAAELETSATSKPGMFARAIPDAELYHFTRLFATLTRAGIPLMETLDLLVKRINNQTLASALQNVAESIREGNGIRASFEKFPHIFERSYLQLLEVGEESGKLPQVLERLTLMLRKRIQLRGMIVKALTYPVLVMTLSFVVVTAILVKIVPRFKDIYSRFGGELPTITRFTLKCSDMLINYFPLFLLLIIMAGMLFHFGRKTVTGKRLYDRLALGLPLFGQMFHTYEIAGFSKSFSMLVHSGITVNSALELISQSIDRVPVKEAISLANEQIRTGKPIAESFDNQNPWLPELLNRMVAVGERSGNLPEMLDHVADFYEEEFNNKVETLASLVEPILIIFLGVVIGGIVISLYLPIFGMARLISQR